MAEILAPRPASTVLTVRDAPEGFEVLMLKRNLNSDFVGGAYVFPGGGVDADDADRAAAVVFGLDDAEASRRLDLESGGLAYFVAALRELFEEAGLLIACTASGESISLADDDRRSRLAASRRAINTREVDFVSVLAAEELWLDLRSLAYLSHWITPVGPPRRYDTRFFVALAPSGQIAAHDAGETVADRWIRPAEALAAHRRGEMEMIFPTIRTLESIEHLERASDVLDFANRGRSIPTIQPRFVTRDDGSVVILAPGDPGYEE